MKKRGKARHERAEHSAHAEHKVHAAHEEVKVISAPHGYEKTVKLLIENNAMMQKKITELTGSVDGLTKKVSALVKLIEKASEEFAGTGEEGVVGERAEKVAERKMSKDELLDKLESLLRQNKTIARGLILLEKYVKEKVSGRRGEEEEGEFQPLPEFKF